MQTYYHSDIYFFASPEPFYRSFLALPTEQHHPQEPFAYDYTVPERLLCHSYDDYIYW